MRIHAAMSEPAVHPIHAAIHVVADNRFLPYSRSHLLCQSNGYDLIGVQAKHPIVFERDIVERPIELKGLVHELVLEEAGASGTADFRGSIGTERIHDDYVIRKICDRCQAIFDLLLIVVGQDDYRDHSSDFHVICHCRSCLGFDRGRDWRLS